MPNILRSVLLVDDNAIVRRGLRALFEAAGFTCSEAENGADALQQSEYLTPSLIVLDLSMPVMNGFEAAPLLRKKLPETPIIMFTMFASQALVDAAVAVGVNAVFSKDEPAQVLSRARSLLMHPTRKIEDDAELAS
jgi:two-component system, NarL family, invasion response regulator UvrY